jgi:hypothetical protein
MPRKRRRERASAWALSSEQERVVVLLAQGKTIAETAESVEISEHTVRSWRWEHPGVQAAVNSRRQEDWVVVTDRLRALVPKALEVLEQELAGETPLSAALHILKACGVYGLREPNRWAELTDPEDIAVEQLVHQQARARERMLAELG